MFDHSYRGLDLRVTEDGIRERKLNKAVAKIQKWSKKKMNNWYKLMTMLMSFTDNNEDEIIKKHEEGKIADEKNSQIKKKKIGTIQKLKDNELAEIPEATVETSKDKKASSKRMRSRKNKGRGAKKRKV